jgi:hypothetical protein
MNESSAVVQSTGTSGIEGTTVLFLVLRTGFFTGCIGIVNPVILVVQLRSVNLTATKISVFLGNIKVGKGFAHFGVIPFDFSLIVNVWWVKRFAILVFFNLVSIHAAFGKHFTYHRVSDPSYELAVFIISDFSLVHEEGGNLHGSRLRGNAIGVVLYTCAHAEISLVDENHTLEVYVLKLVTVQDTGELTVR